MVNFSNRGARRLNIDIILNRFGGVRRELRKGTGRGRKWEVGRVSVKEGKDMNC